MFGFRFPLAPLLALSVAGLSMGIIWLAHLEAGEMTLDRRPPMVKASTAPLKRSPADPGGSAVADLGGVGDLLRDGPAAVEERLLPGPEQPVRPADGGTGALADDDQQTARAALEALVSEARNGPSSKGDGGAGGPNPDAPVEFPSSSRPSAAIETAEPVTPITTSTLDDEPQPAPPEQPAGTEVAAVSPTFRATANGRYRVQLAAVRAEDDAKRAWEVFQERLGPFMSGLQPFFERAETSNGVFYRVQIGPFGETEEAERLCIELKKQNASCFVVTR